MFKLKGASIFLSLALVATLFTSGCKKDDVTPTFEERVVVANRGAESISFINAKTDELVETVMIEGAEPMYVVYVPARDKVYVGDRAQNKVHIVNPATRTVESSIDVGQGVFHMWANGDGSQLWVNNDMDNTISVINLQTNTVIQTIEVGIKPHDVFVTQDGSKAYVSVITTDAMTPDSIYMYSTNDYSKIGAQAVGKDPHLFHITNSNKLFVPCQSGDLFTLDGDNLTQTAHSSLEGAHGVFATPNQSQLIVTNISGAQLYIVNTMTDALASTLESTGVMVPHNVVINKAANKVFVSHSGGTATNVTSYSLAGNTLTPEATITTDTNPFGIAYYERESN